MKFIIRFGYLPFMLIGMNGLALYLIESQASMGWIFALFLGAIGCSFLAERLIPHNPVWNTPQSDGARDFLHALVNESATLISLAALPASTAILAVEGLWPSGWAFPLQVLLAIFIADAGITLTHFLSHRVDLLWRFHAVHHSVKRMYGFNGLMKHPIHQTIETGAGTLPLVLMGIPVDVAFGFVVCVLVQLLLQHSNADYGVGPLKHWLVLNQVHRFHHQKDPELGDVNFGLFTTLWDHLLGTFHYERRDPFTSDELGIDREPDYPIGYAKQLIRPFLSAPSAA